LLLVGEFSSQAIKIKVIAKHNIILKFIFIQSKEVLGITKYKL